MALYDRRAVALVDNGFVFLGHLTWNAERSGYDSTDTYIVMGWGTKEGLGGLALHGPDKETKLNPCGTTFIPNHAVLCIIDCTYDEVDEANE